MPVRPMFSSVSADASRAENHASRRASARTSSTRHSVRSASIVPSVPTVSGVSVTLAVFAPPAEPASVVASPVVTAASTPAPKAARVPKPKGKAQTATPVEKTFLVVSLLQQIVDTYLLSCDIAGHSTQTIQSRRSRFDCILWWMNHADVVRLDDKGIALFLSYLKHGHKEPGGRFGNPRLKKPVSPGTSTTYHRDLSAFFKWCIDEGHLTVSPLAKIPKPINRPDQIQPFTDEQLARLLLAAKRPNPESGQSGRRGSITRDEAIFYLLLDTGLRVSELCSLTVGDVDMHSSQLRVMEGKGGKLRVVPFSPTTRRAVYRYLQERGTVYPQEALLLSEHGEFKGEGLTLWGVGAMVERWGKAAKIENVRCTPHTFRHTFAIKFLRNGGNVFTLKQLLGHTTLTMTNRYVALAEADITRQHAQFSPVMSLGKQSGKGRRG